MIGTSISPDRHQVCAARRCLLVYAGCMGDPLRPSWLTHVEPDVLGVFVTHEGQNHPFYYATRVAGTTDKAIRWEFLPCVDTCSILVPTEYGKTVDINRVIVVAGSRGGSPS